MSSEIEIGISSVEYDTKGEVVNAYFKPTLHISVSAEMLNRFSEAKPKDIDYVKKHSELVMASWFAKTNEIELADREQYEIISRVYRCERYPDEQIKLCQMIYTFRKRIPQ